MKKIMLALFLSFAFWAYSQEYKLMWEDNFDNPVLDEVNTWTVEINGEGGGNKEMQFYRRENISIEKHKSGVNCLVLTAKKEKFSGKEFTSGRLVTRGDVSFKYGKIEARIKLPATANGLWPAFWMLGEDQSINGWPRCGEIDILEMGNAEGITKGTQDRLFNGACHWGENWSYFANSKTADKNLQEDFHLFTLIWDEKEIKMYLDLDKFPSAKPYYQLSIAGNNVIGDVSHYFHKSFCILFNLAVGGGFTGIVGEEKTCEITALSDDNASAKMYVDYVRVYQKGTAGEEFKIPATITDTEIPTAFNADKGIVTHNSVELVLNSTDNAGKIIYYITYNGLTHIVKSPSRVQKSYFVNGLNSAKDYTFTIVAKDANGNMADRQIVIPARTGSM